MMNDYPMMIEASRQQAEDKAANWRASSSV